MTPFDGQPDGATPLTTEDVEGLKPSWVSSQAELNQAEAESILRGRLWASRARRPPFWYLRDAGLKDLHQRMFGTADTHAWPPIYSSPTLEPNRSPGEAPSSPPPPTSEPTTYWPCATQTRLSTSRH
jgi:hypothetical protein